MHRGSPLFPKLCYYWASKASRVFHCARRDIYMVGTPPLFKLSSLQDHNRTRLDMNHRPRFGLSLYCVDFSSSARTSRFRCLKHTAATAWILHADHPKPSLRNLPPIRVRASPYVRLLTADPQRQSSRYLKMLFMPIQVALSLHVLRSLLMRCAGSIVVSSNPKAHRHYSQRISNSTWLQTLVSSPLRNTLPYLTCVSAACRTF